MLVTQAQQTVSRCSQTPTSSFGRSPTRGPAHHRSAYAAATVQPPPRSRTTTARPDSRSVAAVAALMATAQVPTSSSTAVPGSQRRPRQHHSRRHGQPLRRTAPRLAAVHHPAHPTRPAQTGHTAAADGAELPSSREITMTAPDPSRPQLVQDLHDQLGNRHGLPIAVATSPSRTDHVAQRTTACSTNRPACSRSPQRSAPVNVRRPQ